MGCLCVYTHALKELDFIVLWAFKRSYLQSIILAAYTKPTLLRS